MIHYITKHFDFCYGHRVWSQTVDDEFTCGRKPKCRHLHGHEGRIGVTLYGDVQENGMVIDFTWLQWLKQWIDEYLDHKFIVDLHDPLLERITGCQAAEVTRYGQEVPMTEGSGGGTAYRWGPESNEVDQGFVFVPFIPTSENLSAWLADLVAYKMSDRFGDILYSVEISWQETPNSVAVTTREIPLPGIK